MPYLNVKERVIEAKIVYYGAGLSGKTTNLERIKGQSGEGHCGEMMSLETDGDRTLFFDWLPYSIGKFNGCDVKMQLYTVPGQAKYGETRKKVLAGADGVVLVLDSEAAALEKNRQCVRDLLAHLDANGLPADIPLVVQLNKRDLPTAMNAEELLREMGLAGKSNVPAAAAKGEGVFETLREITKLVLASVRDSARKGATDIKSGESSGLDGATLYEKVKPSAAAPETVAAPVAKAAAAPAAPSKAAPPPSASSTKQAAVKTPATTQREEPAPSGSQLNEVIAGHRALSRRIDQMEQKLLDALVRAVADTEKRLTTRIADAQTTSKSVLGHVDDASEKVVSSLGELETRLKEDIGQRTDALRKVVEASAADGAKRVETAVKPIPKIAEGTTQLEAKLQSALVLLQQVSTGVRERLESQAEVIVTDRTQTSARIDGVEAQLNEMTELFAQMVDKKQKSWWR